MVGIIRTVAKKTINHFIKYNFVPKMTAENYDTFFAAIFFFFSKNHYY